MAVNFDTLYDLYNSNNLVIIVGSELLRIRNENMTFEQKVIEQITRHPYNVATGPKTYSDLAIKEPDVDSNRLIGIYNNFQRQDNFDTALIQLVADLPNVNLFVSTAFNAILEQLLGENAEAIVWNHKIKEPIYLNLQNGKRKLLYLFGNIPQGISVFEEEQIDCLMSLATYNERNNSKTQDRYSFLEYLKDKTLVFIGNNFPDWFMRLIIRTLYNAPVTIQPNKAYIINDKRAGLNFEKYFFEKFRIELIHEFPIENFLNELHHHIRKNETFDNRYKPKKVFISYDRTDSEFGLQLKRSLNIKHIDAFFDVEDMGANEHEKKITSLLQARETCIFVTVLSAALMAKTENDSYVKRVEWSTASARYSANDYLGKVGQAFSPFIVMPIAVDDFENYTDKLPPFISKNNIHPSNLENFCDLIEDEIQKTIL
jgi:SIR2-like domain/TIR domain